MEKRPKDDKLFIMTYTLRSGTKGTVPLSNKNINVWLECYIQNNKFIVAIDKEYFGLDPKDVADFKVYNGMYNEK